MHLAKIIVPFALPLLACSMPASPPSDGTGNPVNAAQPATAAVSEPVGPPAAAAGVSGPFPPRLSGSPAGVIDPSLIVVSNDHGVVHVTGRPHAIAGNAASVSITALHSATADMASEFSGRAATDTILGSVIQPLDPDGGFAETVLRGRLGLIPAGDQLVLAPQGATQPNVGPTVTLVIP